MYKEILYESTEFLWIDSFSYCLISGEDSSNFCLLRCENAPKSSYNWIRTGVFMLISQAS